MRKSYTQPLADVLREYLKVNHLDHKLKETRLMAGWPDVVGVAIAKRTTRLAVKNRVLFVYLSSSVVRNELLMIKQGLVKALNDKAGENLIDDVVIR
jgi:predicted nucleic acid-binding Zn ribbon protein